MLWIREEINYRGVIEEDSSDEIKMRRKLIYQEEMEAFTNNEEEKEWIPDVESRRKGN